MEILKDKNGRKIMVRITEDLIRKRAEHNELMVSRRPGWTVRLGPKRNRRPDLPEKKFQISRETKFLEITQF